MWVIKILEPECYIGDGALIPTNDKDKAHKWYYKKDAIQYAKGMYRLSWLASNVKIEKENK
jgi:hypothetical protein